MTKKVAVLVRDRQHEALRMALGLTLADNSVSVFIMDTRLASDENIEMSVETLGDMNAKIYSNNPENKFTQMATEEIAQALTEYNIVIPY
ncbi:MAG: hypothetical protein A3J81_08400 [Nitrospirae bacterium RIFOXYB2_FULL_43_5]|nr:MAG: hypothetical protein A2X54_04315 [Nitrospirae bacterium GWF2_44_13]OGW33982.1 MAG: hypothetical protein A2088_00880 [Nitrospirae bacterium GWD2_44_7]OGW64351.1 MAG: hypothetical protein A2222_03015 [Nitrospirae bacterium RIFOXYA2_FULL_44_9]OGW76240.1 MAG: hypothetical protein A3J81_08400 [Nitrospirae bacterium RIFOXYB2_FULL_43_5]HBG93298.1 hypothetical protein [Nitrospiraceae bacterium]